MRNEDNAAYLKYTGPQRIDKAMHSLEGIVRGVAVDGKVNTRELSALTGWIGDHCQYADRHPFNEVLDRLNEILRDGVVDEEEKADILWLCNKFSTENAFFPKVSSDMQRLQGIMGGIAADGKISRLELKGLQQWMNDNTHLRTCWPYDELDSLIVTVLQDGVINETEHNSLLRFFSEFIEHPGHRALELPETEEGLLVKGVCAVCPEVEFRKRTFCFTGRSERFTRKELAEQVEQHGGIFSARMTKTVDYLIVGADGNPCWAFACYGRKVEAAVSLRKQGLPLLIVHEYDYWNALQDYA